MKFAVIYSKKDEAGMTIAKALKEHFLPHVNIVEVSKDSINCEDIDKDDERLKDAEFIIFATKHQSKENRNNLSLHAPGNWRNADYGGKPGKICRTSSLAMKFLYERMNENLASSKIAYETTMECTHHGPLIDKPCCFIEVGTTTEQWNNKSAAEVIAKTIADFQNFQVWKNKAENKMIRPAIAIGGPHYAPNFNKIQVSKLSNIAIGHIIPEYAFPLNESMLHEAIEKNVELPKILLMDWKGCGNSESRQKILELAKKLDIEVIRTDQIEK